jgi:hypothetical protein
LAIVLRARPGNCDGGTVELDRRFVHPHVLMTPSGDISAEKVSDAELVQAATWR